MNTMMLPSMQTDKTLSIEGVAADAKAVGEALTLKTITKTVTVNQYSLAFFEYPKDFKMAIQFICGKALLVPQFNYENGIEFRCFGNTTVNSLSPMFGETINITLYYL